MAGSDGVRVRSISGGGSCGVGWTTGIDVAIMSVLVMLDHVVLVLVVIVDVRDLSLILRCFLGRNLRGIIHSSVSFMRGVINLYDARCVNTT